MWLHSPLPIHLCALCTKLSGWGWGGQVGKAATFSDDLKLGPETYTYTMMRRVRVRGVADQSDHCRNRNRNRNRNRDRFPFWLAPFPHPPRKPRCEALSAPQQLGCTTRCLISESHHASFRYRPRSCFAIDLFGRALVRNALPQRSPRTQRLPI